MKFKIYAVRDQKTDMYSQPFFLMSDGQAMRAFGDDVNRQAEDNPLFKHPEDYELFALGEWESETAEFSTHTPRSITAAATMKQ